MRSEFWGKWITSAELACRWEAGSGVREKVEQAVTGLQAAQGPDGYIGAYTPENRLWNWDVWGRKYTMLGLLGWNEISGDASALVSARRLADHLLSETGPGRPDVDLFRHDMWSGMASSSVIEPMTLLYPADRRSSLPGLRALGGQAMGAARRPGSDGQSPARAGGL